MLCGQLRHQCFHSFCIADVTPQMDNARCTFAYTLFGLAGAADDINCRAGLSQHICDLETDPAAAAGHDTGLSLQTCHKKHLLSLSAT